jgi:hypothetical protein
LYEAKANRFHEPFQRKGKKMNIFRKSVSGLAILTGCLGLMAATANAQSASFKLPVEARWGTTVLEPGDYKVHFPTAADTFRVVRISGEQKTFNFVVPVTTYERNNSGSGRLTLVDVNGQYRVRSISEVSGDRTFSFPLPKAPESAIASTHQNQAKIAVQIKAVSR